MPIPLDKFRDEISTAVVNAARDWSGHQQAELNTVVDQRPLLNAMPAVFRAAAWLNTGIDTTATLFPDSFAGQALARLSVPVTITQIAMKAFQDAYKNEVMRVNELMAGDYGIVSRKLQNNIDHAADYLPATPFGQKAIETLESVLSKRLDEYKSAQMVYSHCMAVIKHERYGIIETDRNEIRARTKAGFEPLLDKIRTVYQATFAPGDGVLWRVDPSRRECYTDVLGHPVRLFDPVSGKKVSCGPEQHWIWNGNMRDMRATAAILANLWQLDVRRIDRWTGESVWVWPASGHQPRIHDIVNSYEKRGLEDFKASLEQADRDRWPTTKRIAGGVA